MREISVSTEVFAKIWSLRHEGEESEDQILLRVLGNPSSVPENPSTQKKVGYFDPRHDVSVPSGFEIFRSYHGVKHVARAEDGGWTHLNDRTRHSSLNSLSRAVTGGSENAWNSWNYLESNGVVSRISKLRDPAKISKKQVGPRVRSGGDPTWRDDVRQALVNLGGTAHLSDIYGEVEATRKSRSASLPPSLEAIVRRELENNSSDSESFMGKFDIFKSVYGLGAGVWALR